jgi:hypothetical protein
MAADLPKPQILPTAARQFWWHRLAPNLPKGIFFVRMRPVDLGECILFKKLLVDNGIEMLPAKTSHWRHLKAFSY